MLSGEAGRGQEVEEQRQWPGCGECGGVWSRAKGRPAAGGRGSGVRRWPLELPLTSPSVLMVLG